MPQVPFDKPRFLDLMGEKLGLRPDDTQGSFYGDDATGGLVACQLAFKSPTGEATNDGLKAFMADIRQRIKKAEMKAGVEFMTQTFYLIEIHWSGPEAWRFIKSLEKTAS